MTSDVQICGVCGGQIAPHMEAFCNNCARPYHLNQRVDLPGEDCGQVWINEEHLALEFACNECLNPAPAAANLDDVLDVAEAAAFANMSEDAIAAAAEGGAIRHRRTSGGVYLFQRGDLVAYLEGRR